jgi:hypothetical protein
VCVPETISTRPSLTTWRDFSTICNAAAATVNWHVCGGTSPKSGSPVTYTLADPVETAPAGDFNFDDFNFGDFFEVGFDNLGRLDIVYTRCTDLVPGDDTTDCLNSDVYFVRST